MADEAPQSVAPATTPSSAPTSTAPATTGAPSSASSIDYQKEYTSMKEKHDALMGLVTYDQEAKAAVQRAYNRARGIPEAPEPKGGEENESTPATPAAPLGPTHVDIAFNKLATKLGNGDPYRGQEIFTKDYLPEFERVASVLYGDDADAKVALLNEYVTLKKGGASAPQTASSRLLDPGFSGERGEAGNAPTPPPDMSKWTAYQRADYHARQTAGVGIDELTRAAFAS